MFFHQAAVGKIKNFDAIENFIKEYIFLPFLEKNSKNLSENQILSMANAVNSLVNAVSFFLAGIIAPEKNINAIFHEPEKKLTARYDFQDGKLFIVGCYDALLFNPDRAEARLFEFKAFQKSDIVLPLSQSLIYSWLIEKYSGLVPSIEIIYLDETERLPDIFSSHAVAGLMGRLPGLFRTAFNVLAFREVPDFERDKNLCNVCPFKKSCLHDWPRKKRKGFSLVSVLVFALLAVVLGTQIFFFSSLSANSDNTKKQQIRFEIDNAIQQAKDFIKNSHENFSVHDADYKSFHDVTRIKSFQNGNVHVSINDLKYNLTARNNEKFVRDDIDFDENDWDSIPKHEKVFAPVSNDKGHYFLIRAYDGAILYQVLVLKSKDNKIITLSQNEIW